MLDDATFAAPGSPLSRTNGIEVKPASRGAPVSAQTSLVAMHRPSLRAGGGDATNESLIGIAVYDFGRLAFARSRISYPIGCPQWTADCSAAQCSP
jgi:hypothetical protein